MQDWKVSHSLIMSSYNKEEDTLTKSDIKVINNKVNDTKMKILCVEMIRIVSKDWQVI